MAESSLPVDVDVRGAEWPRSTVARASINIEDNSSRDGEQSPPSSEKREPVAVTVRSFLELCSMKNHGGMSIAFEELCAEGSGTGSQAAPTVTQAAKTFFGVLDPIMKGVKAQRSRRILHNFRGTMNPGEMVLVIGKPGSGCTTFLKTLANMREEYKDITGSVRYGGMSASDMAAQRPRDIIFCSEDDDHFPTLSVAETLRFALRALRGPRSTKEGIDNTMKCLAKLVGLDDVLNTKVGNQYIRGVSGGERRRTSLAEAIATCARLMLLDNPTNGLDSATAVEFIETMRELTTQSRSVTAMSIYQGSEAILHYFDKVLVINSGRQIYYGKVSEAKSYFQELGFSCLPTTTTTDFLNSMSADPEARQVADGVLAVPRTPEEFEREFKNSQQYNQVTEDLKTLSQEAPSILNAPAESTYALPLYHQIWHCAIRQFRILISDYSTWGIEAACIIVQSLVLGTLFRDQARATQSFFILASSLFYSVLVPALQAMSEFGNTFAQRPLILKHKRYSLYRPAAYAFGLVFTDSAWKIMAIAYNIPLYFLTGFQQNASNFFIWFFIVYIEHLALSMFFRSLAVFSSNINRAVLPVGIFFNMYVLYTGLYVPPPQMQVWLGWLRYLNPLYYGFESVMVNEFASLTYACSEEDIVPSGSAYSSIANQVCGVVGSTPGKATVAGIDYLRAQYGFEASHLWRNVGVNAGLFVAFALCTGVGMELLKVPAGRLNTIFYKSAPLRPQGGSDQEKGAVGHDIPMSAQAANEKTERSKDSEDHSQTFEWQDICLDIETKEGTRRLLDNLSGEIKRGHMKALMGMSGAGKTTLLNMLAGRNSIGKSTGDLYLNRQALPKSFGRYMGYVQQQDIHLPTQTIREALQMTAQLRRPQHIPTEEKNAYVETVIQWLEMEEIADALIGVPGAGLNLEQRKRVTVGVEMAAKPEILFLDEPTSGLDGQSAASIVRLLRKLTDSGQAIICTIHQPAAQLIGTFDELYLLARGGKLVYDGPLGGGCKHAINYFEKHARSCNEHENPAEYFLEVVGAGSRGGTTLDWPKLWMEETTQQGRHALNNPQNEPVDAINQGRVTETKYGAPLHTQLMVVLRRAWLFYWREPDYITSKLWMNVGNSLLNSLTYLQSPTTQKGAYNRVFSAFMSLIVGPPLGLQVEPRFVMLRDIFTHREKASATYSWFAFVVSAILIELPYAFVTSLVYWLLWYFPVGYSYESARAGYSFLMYELFAIFATSLAQLCATIMPNLSATFMANGFFFMYCNTFAGTLSPKPVTPSGWSWYYNVSPLFYLGEGVTVNVLQDLPINCTPDEVLRFQPPNGTSCGAYTASFLQSATGYLLNPGSQSDCEYCRYKDGQSYYTQYGYEWSHRISNIGIFIGFIAFNYTLIILITYLVRVKKWRKN